jgi:hypothetical protein
MLEKAVARIRIPVAAALVLPTRLTGRRHSRCSTTFCYRRALWPWKAMLDASPHSMAIMRTARACGSQPTRRGMHL